MTFHGMPVTLSPYLTDPETRTVRRSWRERLFTWPWHPFRATQTLVVHVPSSRIVQAGRMLIMHPATWQKLRDVGRG